jgi:hypothetical protein
MAKNKKKNKSQRQAGLRKVTVAIKRAGRNRGKNNVLNRALTTVMSPAYELGCSMKDPWSCSACIPDGSTNTGCFSVKQEALIGTGTGSSCLVAFDPILNTSFLYTDTGSTAATPTVTGSWSLSSNIGAIKSYYGSSRCVSAGLKCSYVGNTQTDGGIILAGTVSGSVPLSFFNGVTLSSAASLFKEYKTYPLRNGTRVLWSSENMMDMANWQDLVASAARAVSAKSSQESPYIVVAVYGANASTASLLSIEAMANYEGQVANNTFAANSQLASQPMKVESGWYEKAKVVASNVPAVTPYIGTAIDTLQGAASGYAAGGLLGAAGGALLGFMGNGLMATGRTGKQLTQGAQPLALTYPGYGL